MTGVPVTSAPEPVLTATGGDDQTKYSRFNIKYYRSVFDVDTSVRTAVQLVACHEKTHMKTHT